MFVKIADIICYMGGYSKAFINTLTGECFYETEKNGVKDYGDYKEIPNVDIKEIKLNFIHHIINYKIKNKLLSCSDKDFHSLFHKVTIDYNLENEWLEFLDEVLMSIAIKWCNENNIAYTLK